VQERIDKVREHHQKVESNVCDLIMFSEWEELLEGIDGFSLILFLYWPRRCNPALFPRRERGTLWACVCLCSIRMEWEGR